MQNKSKRTDEKNDSRNPYKINKAAVDRLVNADKKTYPKTNVDPGKQYRSKGFIDKIPDWIKALFIKFWFNGAVCFFIFWGLSLMITNFLDMMVVFGIVLGIVTDIFVNNIFRFIENYPGQNSKWMMFPKKKFWTFFANIAYAMVVLLGVFYLYNAINYMILGPSADGAFFLAVEPIVFGLLYLLVDMALISIKKMIVSIVSDAIEQNRK